VKYTKKDPGKYARFDKILPTQQAEPTPSQPHHSWTNPAGVLDDVQGLLSRGLHRLTDYDGRRAETKAGHGPDGGAYPASIQLVRR
jgi:hypothetical protein